MELIIFVHVCVVTGTAVDRPLLDSGNGWSISDFAAGLHREGSKAVFRYTSLELADRFALLNAAFGEEGYKWERLENYGKILYLDLFLPKEKCYLLLLHQEVFSTLE